jgi:predicted RNA methylase
LDFANNKCLNLGAITMYKVKIDQDVLDVLQKCTITENTVVLPGQMDRKLYMKVDKVLNAAGGKWNRKVGAHVFSQDPRAALELGMETGEVQNETKVKQQFFTPTALAQKIIAIAKIKKRERVLEPSAGSGALAIPAHERSNNVMCFELDEQLVEELRKKHLNVMCVDFLDTTASPTFDCVVMNPPFTKGQDLKHVLHAFKFLKPGGRLVSVISGGSTKTTLQDMIKTGSLSGRVEDLPDGSFQESGTSVRSALVFLKKDHINFERVFSEC